MRRLFAYLILTAFLALTFSQMLIVVNYVVNIDYISTYLCENQDKPELECNGKCHLKKELEKDTERKGEETNTQLEVHLCVRVNIPEVKPTFSVVETRKHTFYYSDIQFSESTQGIFHPPQIMA